MASKLGYRQLQIMEVVHEFVPALDNKQQIDVICIDFANTFDKVTQDKLIFKLQEIGIGRTLVTWINEYLSKQTKTVCLNDSLSRHLEVFWGVPQGSVLGPLLVLTYINDIFSVVEHPVRVKLFAAGCLFYSTVTRSTIKLALFIAWKN